MVKKIQQKIVGMAVVHDNAVPQHDPGQMLDKDRQPEKTQRPAELLSSTYTISTPLIEQNLSLTISDVILNQGTQHELRRPFEISINSENMDDLQWLVVLLRIISAVFRKGGDVSFLVEELRGAFDPGTDDGNRDGRHVLSLVSGIGDILETHLRQIRIPGVEIDDHSRCGPQ
jgi:hypothetical protein